MVTKRFFSKTVTLFSASAKENLKLSSHNFETVFSFPLVKYIAIFNRLKIYSLFGSALMVPSSGLLEYLGVVPDLTSVTTAYLVMLIEQILLQYLVVASARQFVQDDSKAEPFNAVSTKQVGTVVTPLDLGIVLFRVGIYQYISKFGITSGVVLSIASLPLKNIIGFLYISEDDKMVKISAVDYWGRRKDRIVPVEDWTPLLDMEPKLVSAVYLTPNLNDGTKYKLFVKIGKVHNPIKMGRVLD